jgi:hypothetical protein
MTAAPHAGSAAPEVDAGSPYEPEVDAGQPDSGASDAGPVDSGTTVAEVTDAGTADGGADAAPPVPPPVFLPPHAVALTDDAAGTCSLRFATSYYLTTSYAQLRGEPMGTNAGLPGVSLSHGPAFTKDIATTTMTATFAAKDLAASAGTHELTMRSFKTAEDAAGTDESLAVLWAWYDSPTNALHTHQADLAFLHCRSWDPASKIWTALADDHCRVRTILTVTGGAHPTCAFAPDGNMTSFDGTATITQPAPGVTPATP